MSKVQLLSSDIISKIAAGEVIERPASVLKELVENSIDAKATDISVRLEDAGSKLIAVKDNGEGINRTDLETIFLRHATSKIRNLEDLENIHSLGFRGEALFAVSAIADVIVRSKPADQKEAWEIHMRGGKKLNLKPTALSGGTEIEVQELFYNTPARRKFLKTNTTEVTQALNTFIPYALLYPTHRFKMTHQNKVLLDIAPDQTLKSRVAHVLNLPEKYLLEATRNLSEHAISLHVIMGDINIKRARKDLQYIFVNGRPVQSRSISFHMNQVFQLIFPPNAHPAFVVYLNIPTSDVDVNIHPTKREVKIRDEQTFVANLRNLVEKTLMTQGAPKQVASNSWGEEDSIGTMKERSLEFGIPSESLIMGPRVTNSLGELDRIGSSNFFSTTSSNFPNASTSDDSCTEIPNFNYSAKRNLVDELKNARYIGQFMRKFLLFENSNTLLLIDQHAGQERIMYEQLKKQYESGNVEIQPLLTPLLINLSPQEMLTFEESQSALENSGISCSQFDPKTIAIHSVPQLLKDPESTIRFFLAEGTIKKFDHHAIARQACRSSVMAGDSLKSEQAIFQRDQLLTCSDPFICPHGRPTVIQLTEEFLNKQFLRT